MLHSDARCVSGSLFLALSNFQSASQNCIGLEVTIPVYMNADIAENRLSSESILTDMPC